MVERSATTRYLQQTVTNPAFSKPRPRSLLHLRPSSKPNEMVGPQAFFIIFHESYISTKQFLHVPSTKLASCHEPSNQSNQGLIFNEKLFDDCFDCFCPCCLLPLVRRNTKASDLWARDMHVPCDLSRSLPFLLLKRPDHAIGSSDSM